jgi:hypothetical protein
MRRQRARGGSAQLLKNTRRAVGRAIAAAVVVLAIGAAPANAEGPCPCIKLNPFSEQTVTAGEPAVFEAIATGWESVQWQVSMEGRPWAPDLTDPGFNTEKLTVPGVTSAQNGWRYRAVFLGPELGEVPTTAARLTVNVPPVVTTQPASATVTAGEPASFTAAATGRPAPATQWQLSTDGGRTFANDTTDPGNATGTLTIASTSVAQNGYQYRAVFRNTAGPVTSTPATLTTALPVPPTAGFAWFPPTPYAGQPVSLASSSTDAASPITGFAWDVAGSGAFGGGGPVMTTSFPTPGSHLVRLRVTDARGLSGVAAETIPVVPPPLVAMLPFPIVRIVASELSFGVRVVTLTVLAPVGSRVTVTCHGRGCPVKVLVRRAVRPRRGRRRTSAVTVTFPRFERSLLRAGAVLEIRVSKPGQIGKYTRLTIRPGRLPVRLDECLNALTSRPISCPSS